MIARPGAASRGLKSWAQSERSSRSVLDRPHPEPGTLEGGDVLKVGDLIYVGRSARTNAEGVSQCAGSSSRWVQGSWRRR